MESELPLCKVCWRDGIAAQAYWYLSTIPVCDQHHSSVCARCRRRSSAWYVQELDGESFIFACSECCEQIERQAARRAAYNQHLGSMEWGKTKKALRRESRRGHGSVVCSRCDMTEFDNKQLYGEDLHGHHATYERFGQEKTEDVELLCSRCHAWEHGRPSPKPLRNYDHDRFRKAMH